MAKKEHISETQATQLLRKHHVSFDEHPYPYEEHGGTSVSARELGVPEHAIRVRCQCVDSGRVPVVGGALVDWSMSMVDLDLEGGTVRCCPYVDSVERNIQRREWFLQ